MEKATQNLFGGAVMSFLLILLLLFVVYVGIQTVQTKRNTIMTDERLEPKRVLVDITTQPQDTVYVYDISEN